MTHRRLSNERTGTIHRFLINGELKGYITTGTYEDGTLGEVFLSVKKSGTFERGLLSTLGLLISMMLQHGIPLSKILEKLEGIRFEPSGLTGNKDIPMCSSVVDYVAKWLGRKFLSEKEKEKEKKEG